MPSSTWRTAACSAVAVYNYPLVEAARIALGTARTWAEEYDNFDEIRFVLFSKEALEIHEQVLATLEKQQAEN